MYIEANTIIMAASLLTALVAIFSAVFAVYRWYLKQNRQDAEIEKIKAEQCLLTYGILACLKGLKEQGCNGPVTEPETQYIKSVIDNTQNVLCVLDIHSNNDAVLNSGRVRTAPKRYGKL